MNKIYFLLCFFLVSYAHGGNHAALGASADTKTSVSNENPQLHTDWFDVKYDDVREVTYIKTKDSYGPSALKSSNDDLIKVAITATINGKIFDPKMPVKVYIAFNRMAGMRTQSQDVLFGANKADVWKPYGKQLFTLNECKDVLFALPTGGKVQIKDAAISYKPSNSTGFMGEQYQWETLIVSSDLDFLNKLREGGKAALCETSILFNKDTISQVRSLISIINGLGSKSSSK